MIWEDFIDDNEEKENGKRRSKKKAAKDFRVRHQREYTSLQGIETKTKVVVKERAQNYYYLALCVCQLKNAGEGANVGLGLCVTVELVSSLSTWYSVLYINYCTATLLKWVLQILITWPVQYTSHFFSLLNNVVDTDAYRGMERPGRKFVRKMSSLKS